VRATWDRLVTIVLGFGVAANGVAMLVIPVAWFSAASVALQVGPLNVDFVRDVGAAHLIAGTALLWFGLDVRARAAAIAGGAFLVLHALVHAAEALPSVSLVDLINLMATSADLPLS
jgi:hypothetical protein